MEYIRWQMNNRGWFLIILDNSDQIVGMIGYTIRSVQVYSDKIQIVEPMYLCCHPKYRKKGLTSVLIDELIRQSVNAGYICGLFCNNIIVPTPIATIRHYSRPLNYKKLRSHNFIEIYGVDDDVAHNKTRIKIKPNKNYVIIEKSNENIREIMRMYNEYMKTFNIHMIMNEQEIENYFFNNKYVKTIFVLDENKKPIDFISYNFYEIVDINTD